MSRKAKNAIIISIILILVSAAGFSYMLFVQGKEISAKEKRVKELEKSYSSKDALLAQLVAVEKEVAYTDSLLGMNTFNIPGNLPEESFFDFVNKYSTEEFNYTGTSVEFKEKKTENGINYYVYRVFGVGKFSDVYNLIYAIEKSKELKKIESADVKANTVVDPKGFPKYLVSFNLLVNVYFANTDQFISAKNKENNLTPELVYNAYFPLIRNEILPNFEELPDVQNAELLSLVPQGAFIKDTDGNTFLMKRGDRVYLGYLTDIDYTNRKVTFTLNKGGLIEELVLEMDKKNKEK